jgi:hypothetical protein
MNWLGQHIELLIMLIGWCLIVVGVWAAWHWPIASIVCGVIAMGLVLWRQE